MTDSAAESPVLSAAEIGVAESLLTEARGKPVAVRSAETIWGRSHIVRLRLADAGDSVVLKRRRPENFDGRVRGFAAELATLEFLNAEETAVAPRLIGASADLLLMEDLGPGSSLAHALLARDRDCAEAYLAAYAQALATMHAWSMGRAASFSSVRARRAPSVPAGPEWPDLRLRDLGVGAARAGRLLSAGTRSRVAGASPRCPPRRPARRFRRTATRWAALALSLTLPGTWR